MDQTSDKPDTGSGPAWRSALAALGQRVLGSASERITFTELGAATRSYQFVASDGRLAIAATDPISAAVALHHYLRACLGRSVGWDTPLPLDLTDLPESPATTATARVQVGYYLNFCAFSYTTAFWSWADWEREIDWMALHGVTMPLAVVGHEAALLRAYTDLGLDEAEVRAFLGGPGYLPFQFMGCVGDFAGPLPTSWIESHLKLGRQVLDRERELGMTPVLPGFAGNVPEALAPDTVTRRYWHDFPSYFLDPTDPLYLEVGAAIARAQQDLFGDHHQFASDPFIEMLPVDSDESYPARVGHATLAGRLRIDSEATWVLQAWPFSNDRDYWSDERVTRFLDATPAGRLLILDLWGEAKPQWERFPGFQGHPWVWCALLNFGGRTDMIGDLPTLARETNRAIHADIPPVGLGLTMEAIHNNPAFFELATDQIWNTVDNVEDWLTQYAQQRYGTRTAPDLVSAWRGLLATVYDCRGQVIGVGERRGALTAKPTYAQLGDLDQLRAGVAGALWYDPGTLIRAWEDLVVGAEQEPTLATGPLGHDLVDVASVVLARVADQLHLQVVEHLLDSPARDVAVENFLATFTDLDRLLTTRPEYTLASWEAAAASWATNPAEHDLYLDNARRIVTVWDDPHGRHLLEDYAARVWAGLTGGYYRARWKLWADGLEQSAETVPGEADAHLNSQLAEAADGFLRSGATVTNEHLGDVVAESRRLFDKYRHSLLPVGPEQTRS